MNEQKAARQQEKAEQDKTVKMTEESEAETPPEDAVQKASSSTQPEREGTDQLESKKLAIDEPDADESIEGLKSKIAILCEALESAKDKSLRAQAEVENIRRRTANEQINTRKFAVEGFATELLSVKDSLDLAEKVELSEDNKDVISKMQEGLSLTLKQLDQIFEKFSVKLISPEKGEKLNPDLHQAMTIMPSDEVDPNCVVDVIQKGYQLHDRLLRPAMVVIAKKIDKKSSESEQ